MLHIVVGPKAECHEAKSKHNCDHIISIQDAIDQPTHTPAGVKNHFHIYFDDLDVPVETRRSTRYSGIERTLHPTKKDVSRILNFSRKLPTNTRLYVHCWAGVSRSTAATFAIFCDRLGPGREDEAMQKTHEAAVYKGIWPNKLMVQYADELLAREGRAIAAVRNWKIREKARVEELFKDKADRHLLQFEL